MSGGSDDDRAHLWDWFLHTNIWQTGMKTYDLLERPTKYQTLPVTSKIKLWVQRNVVLLTFINLTNVNLARNEVKHLQNPLMCGALQILKYMVGC